MVRAQYEEQLGWAAEEGVDFVIAETNDYVGEALIGLEVCQELGPAGHGHVRSVQAATTYDGYDYVEACRILADRGAAVVGLNCSRGPETMLPLLERIRAAVDIPVAAQPVPYRTSPATPAFEALTSADGRHAVPDRSSSRSSAPASRWRTSRAAPATSASTTSASAAAARRTTCARWPRRSGATTPASRYSPAIELHPVLGTPTSRTEVMGGWAARSRGLASSSSSSSDGDEPVPASSALCCSCRGRLGPTVVGASAGSAPLVVRRFAGPLGVGHATVLPGARRANRSPPPRRAVEGEPNGNARS